MLEVMVAVAILGLALTVILSAQAGLYAASTHAQNESVAIGMVRCKMGEIEEELLRLGYQETDLLEDGECCEDQTPNKMRCKWKIERVELPNPPTFDELNPAGNGASMDLSGPGSTLPGGGGPLGALMSAGANDGAALKEGGMGALTSMLGESSGSVAGLAPMVMNIVYPSLKPMLEASIRKVTVTVVWKEGINERDLSVVQYVTNPMRGGLAMSMEGMDPEGALGGALGGGLDGTPAKGQFGGTTPAPTGRPTTPISPLGGR